MSNDSLLQQRLVAQGMLTAAGSWDHMGWTLWNVTVISGEQSGKEWLAMVDRDGFTMLHMAACNDQETDIAEFLLDCGIDSETRNNDGKTALHYACQNANPAMVRLLLDRGADPLVRDHLGYSVLHSAAWFSDGSDETLRLLFQRVPNFDLTVGEFDELDTYEFKQGEWLWICAYRAAQSSLLEFQSQSTEHIIGVMALNALNLTRQDESMETTMIHPLVVSFMQLVVGPRPSLQARDLDLSCWWPPAPWSAAFSAP